MCFISCVTFQAENSAKAAMLASPMHGSRETNWGTNENKGRLVCRDARGKGAK